ncbi:MAG: Lrp/AsnC ligand binding domain-containing protein [Candidatus Nanoarchaeia archaeon]
MPSAYVLIRSDSGMEKEIIDDLLEFDEIEEAELIYGEWDIIVKLKVDEISQLGNFILENIRSIKGVKQTSTLIVT